MDDQALMLARLRAGGPRAVVDAATVLEAAELAARRVVPVGTDGSRTVVTLAWADDADLSPETWPIARRELSPTVLLTLATCLGCCWPDAATEPYPGHPTSATTVLRVLTSRNTDERWAKGALHDLEELGCITRDGDEIRLGPAIAALARTEVSMLRREHAALPREDRR